MFIPLESLPSSSTLVKDFTHSFDKVSRFFNGDYHHDQVYRRLLPAIGQAPRAARPALIERLTEQNKNFHASRATMQNIELLAKPDSLAVVTGQQVGLFTGPLYTIYKALTTCKLAASLSQQLQRPVVPVFYLVTEDHDFDEVRWLGLWNQNHQYQKVHYTPAVMPQRIPMSKIILDESIEPVLQALQTGTPDSEFKNTLLDLARHCYHPGASFVSAFAQLFSQLLRDLGVILLDASDPQLKELARPILQKEVAEFTSVSAMMQTNAELVQNGYHTQLAVHPSRPHLFLLDQGRHSLEKEGDRLRNMHSNETFSITELMQQIERTSPKAALRPIVQDWLLPTIAYVGGPGEIAYFAQLKRVYAGFGIPMPVVVPRAGFTLVEPKIQRHLDKFSLQSVEVILQAEACLLKIQETLVPQHIKEYLGTFRLFIENKWPDLAQAVTALDSTLQTPVQKTERQITSALHQLETKVQRSLQQKETVIAEQWQAVRSSLLPDGVLQERQVNALPFLMKYGESLLTTLYQKIDLQRLDHQIVNL